MARERKASMAREHGERARIVDGEGATALWHTLPVCRHLRSAAELLGKRRVPEFLAHEQAREQRMHRAPLPLTEQEVFSVILRER